MRTCYVCGIELTNRFVIVITSGITLAVCQNCSNTEEVQQIAEEMYQVDYTR